MNGKIMKKRVQNHWLRWMLPAIVFGAFTGVLTAAVVIAYKLCAKQVIYLSEQGYQFLRGHLYWIPLVLIGFFGLGCLLAHLYRRIPNLRGGGIPASIGVLRGIIPMKWLRNVVGVFFLSLSSFLIGVPLGNEGPSVQIGTALGRGSVASFGKRYRGWDRYSMTGGACAGFSVATGAPISGILFAIEEAHERISPIILIVASTSVVFAELTNQLLSPLLGVSTALFPSLELRVLSVRELWLPLLVGVAMGVFSILFLRYYHILNRWIRRTVKKIPHSLTIALVFCATLLVGLFSVSFVSSGHHLILSLFDESPSLWFLLLILAVRTTLTIAANSNGITGGMFLPLLALGATLTSLLNGVLQLGFGLGEEYTSVILVLGIVACISGMMKQPLTAVVFAVEALSGYANILPVINVSAVSFVLTEIFSAHSINDSVLETRIDMMNEGREQVEIDTSVRVQAGSFAIGKQIRDVFWPNGLHVLTLRHVDVDHPHGKAEGGREMREGDLLHVHCQTYDRAHTMEELCAIVGEQETEK